MSLLSGLLQQLIGSDAEEPIIERPCSNCPSNCAIAGQGACPECEPYKRQLIDQIYHIDHLEEFYARYEVIGTTSNSVSGTVICPVCGARSANPYVCEYCDTPFADAPESSGKIRVERASDIPNPIMDAQNIIFERYEAVTKKYTSSKESRSLLGDLFDALTGGDDDEDSSLGAKMSEAEIKEAAELYKMSIGDYLTGLDNGTCLTLKGKKAADQQAQFSSAASEPASFGLPGIAGIGLLSSALIHQTEIQPHFYRPPTLWGAPRGSHKPPQGAQPQSLWGNLQGMQKPPQGAQPQSLWGNLQGSHKPPQGAQSQSSWGNPQGNSSHKPPEALLQHLQQPAKKPGRRSQPHPEDDRRQEK